MSSIYSSRLWHCEKRMILRLTSFQMSPPNSTVPTTARIFQDYVNSSLGNTAFAGTSLSTKNYKKSHEVHKTKLRNLPSRALKTISDTCRSNPFCGVLILFRNFKELLLQREKDVCQQGEYCQNSNCLITLHLGIYI